MVVDENLRDWRGRSTPRSTGMRPNTTWGSLGLVTKRMLAAQPGEPRSNQELAQAEHAGIYASL